MTPAIAKAGVIFGWRGNWPGVIVAVILSVCKNVQKGRYFIQLKAESVTGIVVADTLIEDDEAVEVNIVPEVDVVVDTDTEVGIDEEVLRECAVVEVDVGLSLLFRGSFALLEIDGDVGMIVEDRAKESSRSLSLVSHGAANTH
ncbi:hypothetical protein SS1G_07445 [Sclerotinia sclerotiorum 1980 UF-70]|uniref:Uncharacterized protein n=1 Tax=Sclerotinia sclerotiorum (strain ATCC 18683 / 1980 / Ss-1) TaxID=665079 RepID=A7EQ45_SCLS1|nr:hypothetical protein SS1G_07445 [Sclerotinia sclerotiorum 1980 UF-70]EDO04961.1 hypothetical protein SS1G_07445 [Sclerotinia sclerotiorum 1980 UF-70]